MQGGYGSSKAGFDDDAFGGYGGYKQQPPPPPTEEPLPAGIPLPPIYGPLRHLLNTAPPSHPFDQQAPRQTVRISGSTGRVAIAAGPGSEAVVPYSLFNQMMLRMERLEKENELLMKVIEELNEVVERERGNEFRVYEHETVATSTAAPAVEARVEQRDEPLPPWRIRK